MNRSIGALSDSAAFCRTCAEMVTLDVAPTISLGGAISTLSVRLRASADTWQSMHRVLATAIDDEAESGECEHQQA